MDETNIESHSPEDEGFEARLTSNCQLRRPVRDFRPLPPSPFHLESFMTLIEELISAIDSQNPDLIQATMMSMIFSMKEVDTIDWEAGNTIASSEAFDRILLCLSNPSSPVFESCLRLLASLCHTCSDVVSEILNRDLIPHFFQLFEANQQDNRIIESFFYVFSELAEDNPETRETILKSGIMDFVVVHLRESNNILVYKAALKCANAFFNQMMSLQYEPLIQFDARQIGSLFETLRWLSPFVFFNQDSGIRNSLGRDIFGLLMNDEVLHSQFEWPIRAEFVHFFLQALFDERSEFLLTREEKPNETFEFLRYAFVYGPSELLAPILGQFDLLNLICVVQEPNRELAPRAHVMWHVVSSNRKYGEAIIGCTCAIFTKCMEIEGRIAVALNEKHFFRILIERVESASLSLKRELALIIATALIILAVSDLEELLVPPVVELFQIGEATDWADRRLFNRTIATAVRKMVEIIPQDSELREFLCEADFIQE
jgi:hypothetical protein